MNLLVKENSQSLCPTISSVTKTGICCLPLWTPKVCHTNSGAIVQARDHVFMIDFRQLVLRASTFLRTRRSIYGHFLRLRVIQREIKLYYEQKMRLSLQFSRTSTEHPTICCFSRTSLDTTSQSSPWSFWSFSLTNRLMSFTTSMWMIHRIHRRSEYCWSFSHPTTSTCFSYCYLIPISIWYSTNSRTTFFMDQSNFSWYHLKLSILSFLRKY